MVSTTTCWIFIVALPPPQHHNDISIDVYVCVLDVKLRSSLPVPGIFTTRKPFTSSRTVTSTKLSSLQSNQVEPRSHIPKQILNIHIQPTCLTPATPTPATSPTDPRRRFKRSLPRAARAVILVDSLRWTLTSRYFNSPPSFKPH